MSHQALCIAKHCSLPTGDLSIIIFIIIIIITVVLYMPFQDYLLRSTPSSVKQNCHEGRDERGDVTNRYLAKSGRKPITSRMASNREGTALCSPLVGDNKFSCAE